MGETNGNQISIMHVCNLQSIRSRDTHLQVGGLDAVSPLASLTLTNPLPSSSKASRMG
jgi:hypothetical protein